MKTLDKEQIKRLHKKMLDATGGLDGIRDETMLDSAFSAAFQTFDGLELYPSTTNKIARIAYGLVCNHPFVVLLAKSIGFEVEHELFQTHSVYVRNALVWAS